MKPYWEGDGIRLYLGDCREVTAWLEADVLVCDPPYGIRWTRGTYNGADKHAGISNDTDTTVRDQALALWGDRPGAVFGDFALPPANVAQTLVWQKPSDAGIFGARMGWRRDAEAIYLVGTWEQRPAQRSSVLKTGEAMSAYTKATGHPHTKPTGVMERIVEQTVGVVADPFAGSGSTLVACRNLGRRAIGVELHEPYAEVIARRLDQGVLDFGSTG